MEGDLTNPDLTKCELGPFELNLEEAPAAGNARNLGAKGGTGVSGSRSGAGGGFHHNARTAPPVASGGFDHNARTAPPVDDDIKVVVERAKKAANSIALLLHARECGGQCNVPECQSARKVVAHVENCIQCTRASCVQAKKLLRHYDTCFADTSGRYCLICSFIRRSADGDNSDVASGATSSSDAASRAKRAGGSLQSLQRPPQREQQQAQDRRYAHLLPSARNSIFKRKAELLGGVVAVKDGPFDRPMPRLRSVSWGGSSRSLAARHPRFDSIPEEEPLSFKSGGQEEHTMEGSEEHALGDVGERAAAAAAEAGGATMGEGGRLRKAASRADESFRTLPWGAGFDGRGAAAAAAAGGGGAGSGDSGTRRSHPSPHSV